MVLADPTILSQVTLVSPDVPLVFFFLLGTNSLIENKKALLTLSILALFLINTRENNLVSAQLAEINLENRFYVSNSMLFKIMANPD